MDNALSGFDKTYAELSLAAVIERGKQLQKEKPSNLNKASLHVLNEEVPCVRKHQNYGSRPRNRNLTTARTAPARSSLTARSSPTRYYRSNSPGFVVSPGSPRSSVISNKKRRLKCPLRIAELAVPSKRYCIETWRDRSDVLPTFMLERLKQLVMNQKVIATVPDAVQCFKYYQGRESSPSPKRNETRSRDQRKSRRQHQDITDIKIMCAVFSQRIAGLMMKRKNFEQCLNDDLEKLSTIVANEIRKLIQNRRVCADYVYNVELLKEMSAKITMWIVDILGEAQSNMLEDELKVKKDHENKMGKDGNLETLIDQYVDSQMGECPSRQLLDLEEEEGPALDAIDTLVENVLGICLINKDSVDYLSPGEESSTDEITPDAVTLDETTPDEARPDGNTVDEMTYESDQERLSFIDFATKVEELDKDNLDVINNIPDENGVYNISETLQQENEDSDSQYGSTGDVDSTDSKKIKLETTDGDNNTNVSDVSVTLEESLDDRKKVKFSQVKDGGTGEFGGLETKNNLETLLDEPAPAITSNKSLENWPNYSHSATILRSDIVFQPPNPSILSVADELWPDDYMSSVLKPSASVSKSITSLGEIKEVDEPEQHDRTILNNYDNSTSSYNASTTSSTSHDKGLFEENEPKTLVQDRWISPERESMARVTPSKLLGDLKALLEAEEAVQLREREIKKDSYDLDDIGSFQDSTAGKGDHIQDQNSNQDDTDTDQNPIIQAIKEKLRQESQAKFDYRVHPQTAPSWAFASASEDSESISGIQRPLEPDELRKWCKDIEHTLINLDQWNKWIDFTCKQILYMKHQTNASNKLDPHERTCVLAGWTKLKKCIDKDAILWRKLNDRTLQVLKTYSRKPKVIENSPIVLTPKIPRKKSPLHNKKRIKKEESMYDVMFTIDGMSTWLHRSIVSTEHIVKCNCRNLLSRPQTSTKKQRKKL